MKSLLLAGLTATLTPLGVLAKNASSAYPAIYIEPGKQSSDYRNVALNPQDLPVSRAASYPHASSNSEYNRQEFAARCAIDGERRNTEVHRFGSWGPQKEPGLWWRLDFGRPVTIDRLVLFLRAAWKAEPTPHDSYWTEALVEFSDGTQLPLKLEQREEGQVLSFPRKTVSWLRLSHLKPAEDKWCALSEVEAWGQDATVPFPALGTASLAASLRSDPLYAKVLHGMMGFQRESWEQGTCAQALLEAGELDAAQALALASVVHANKDGIVAAYGGSNMDPLMLGETLWWAAHRTGDPGLLKAAEAMLSFALKGAPRAADGTPFHVSKGREVWSDETFTSPPLLACTGHLDEAIAQLEGMRRRLWDPKAKLMWHRWAEDRQSLMEESHWGGGNGWTAAAFVRLLRQLPGERTDQRRQLISELTELLDGCLALQRPDGLFHDDPAKADSYVETNLSAMLAYAIFEAVRERWIPERYLAPADRMRAAVRAKVDEDGFVQGVAGAPNFDRPGISTEGQAFFILMEAAALKAGRPRLP
jgi:rhamnogalacturonyl hydrolase YesR